MLIWSFEEQETTNQTGFEGRGAEEVYIFLQVHDLHWIKAAHEGFGQEPLPKKTVDPRSADGSSTRSKASFRHISTSGFQSDTHSCCECDLYSWGPIMQNYWQLRQIHCTVVEGRRRKSLMLVICNSPKVFPSRQFSNWKRTRHTTLNAARSHKPWPHVDLITGTCNATQCDSLVTRTVINTGIWQ